ncbi:AhpC/TSA family protein [Flavobacteriaceae bacterium]|nr:AhpC/TSA family protein [Flavobacteriaceae bacterium]
MKNILFCLFGIFALSIACDGSSNDIRVKGTTDLENGSKIFHIIADLNNQPKILDTIQVNAGKFSIDILAEEPSIHFFQIEGIQGSFPFVAESGNVTVELYKDSIGSSKATGTVSNNDFMKYKTETQVYITSLNAIGNDLQQALILKDSLLSEDLKEQYQEVRNQIQNYELELIKASPNSFISILILERFVENQIIPNAEAKAIFDNFDERIKNTASGRTISTKVNETPKAKVGQIAPFFEGPDPEGTSFNLADRLGRVTIIDFWASWCRPCRVENPNLVRLYNKHKDNGLNIIGVSLDRTKPKWVQAIADDGLDWDHVSNLLFWNDPIAKMYQVSAIPATFILDENGIIVSRDLRGISLERKIDELLGVN